MRLTLKAKLGTTFATIVVLSGVSMFVAIQNLGYLNNELSKIVEGNVQRIAMANDMSSAAYRMARDEKDHIIAVDDAQMKQLSEQMKSDDAVVRANVQKLRATSPTEEGKRRVDAVAAAWDVFAAAQGNREILRDELGHGGLRVGHEGDEDRGRRQGGVESPA
jgi:methyl-accepting chemotaxis protein